MDGSGTGSLEERVGRLEARADGQDRELRYALRRLNRILMDRGSAAPESGRGEAPRSSPPTTEPSFAPPIRPPRTVPRETQRPEMDQPRDQEPVRPAVPEPVPAAAAVGDAGDEGGRGFRLPFDLGGLRSGEWWLNKVGIALLLFGVAFLFKFSWDQGWLQALLTPWVRVGVGLAIGAGLISIGFRVAGERRAFGQVLFGGGIGAFYITGFSAFQVLELVPYAVAFAFMVAVTVLAFALSLRQDEAVLSVIGVTGGLATPFLLYDESGSLTGLFFYASPILAGSMGIHFFKGWRSLLPISFLGFWAVLLIGYSGATGYLESISLSDQRALQTGVIFGWLALWIVPVMREVLRSRNAPRWPLPEPGAIVRAIQGERIVRGGTFMHGLSFAAPLVALLFTQGIWDLEKADLGWVALGLAAAHAFAFAAFRRTENGGRMSYTQALVALLLATLSLVLLLEGNALLFTLAAEAAALHLLARRLTDRILSIEAHLLALIVGVWLAVRLFAGTLDGVFASSNPVAFFDTGTLVDFAAIALLFASSMVVAPLLVQRAYRIAAYAAVAGLLVRELLPLDNGETYALVALAVYAVGLHALSRRYPVWGTVVGVHLLSGVVGIWFGVRMVAGILEPASSNMPVFNLHGLADLFVILLSVAVSALYGRQIEVYAYRLAACVAFSLWLLRELGTLSGGDGYVLLAWAVFAAALFWISSRISGEDLLAAAHLQFAAAGVLLVWRLFNADFGAPAVFNVQSLIDLGVIVIAVLISWRFVPRKLVPAYGIFAHAALLAWLWRELSTLPAGDAYVSVAWGVCGAALLILGLRRDSVYLIRSGMATLFLVVAKLFLWDLAWVEAIWRVLLFMGFGGLFLFLSYYLRTLWNNQDGPHHPGNHSSTS